jgi:hypothetical protein
MAMLLGLANGSIMVRHVLDVCEGALSSNHTIGSIMVRHVLDVCEGALPSNHTIPMLSLFPCFNYKHSKNKMLPVLQMV